MADKHLIEKTLSSKEIFQGSFMKVMQDIAELPDGTQSTREFIKHSGAVAILALDNENNLIMERQYRYSVCQIIYEIPAGKLDPNEDILSCGRRELVEETGYVAKEWTYLGNCLPCVGYSTEKISYYLARDLAYTEPQLDEGEFIEVVKQPLDEVMEMAFNGQIQDSKTLSGLMLLYGYLKRNV